MPRPERHARLKKWIKDALGDKVLSTIQIQSAIANREYETCGRIVRVKHTPSIQKLACVLNVNSEFERVNKYSYPAEWKLKNQ